jgi:hypothetical protein
MDEGQTVTASLINRADPSVSDTTPGFHYDFALPGKTLVNTYSARASGNFTHPRASIPKSPSRRWEKRLTMKFIPVAMCVALATSLHAETASAPGVQVNYQGIDQSTAQAVAETLSAARTVYIDDFGMDMPEKIVCSITCGPGNPSRLYTDGHDRVFLSAPSKAKFEKPEKSGTFMIYGLCHEVGHIAMYRTLRQRDWMTTAAAEGWAHFAGSVVVDRVYEMKGQDLWPDKYDYREDGTARLDRALKSQTPSPTDRGAEQWQLLDQIIGRRNLRAAFECWQTATVDLSKPVEGLASALASKTPEKQQALEAWWKSAAPILVEARQPSAIKVQTIDRGKLTGQPIKPVTDDNAPDGKKSIAGSGHLRRSTAPGDGEWYLVAVSVYGSRYGPVRAPDSSFELWLCDDGNNPITSWPLKYALFPRGEAKWTRLEVPPTRVPREFAVCLNFKPTATNGVFVHLDSSTSGKSFSALPGKETVPLDQGDWMIRLEFDQPKASDAMGPSR